MVSEAIPRLVIRLRSSFPEAIVEMRGSSVAAVTFERLPHWEILVTPRPLLEAQKGEFHVFQSSLVMRYQNLEGLTEDEFQRLLSFENQGLRGVSVLAHELEKRSIRVRAGFVGQKGRTRDESENIVIDILSLLRFARLLEDRILRSTIAGDFCLETYRSQYIQPSRGRNRYINYARNIFQGSSERVFGQVCAMLREDYQYRVQITGPCIAKVWQPGTCAETVLRVPEEVPMVVCFAPLQQLDMPVAKALALISELNQNCVGGHFELGTDGKLVSYATWKHLTNDLRYYGLDHMISNVNRADGILRSRLTQGQLARAENAPTAAPELRKAA